MAFYIQSLLWLYSLYDYGGVMTEIFEPFSKIDSWFTTIKDMEKRWGLSLVSFLPLEAQQEVKSLKNKISNFPGVAKPPSDPNIEFYGLSHLHCTHLTLKRSNGWWPLKTQDFVKSGHDLFELFEIVNNITSQVSFIKVGLDTLQMSPDGLGIVLVGMCSDDASAKSRKVLLENLNNVLPKAFKLSVRSWDIDPLKYHALHCRIGFLKRPIDNYHIFAENVHAMEFTPISFLIKEVAIVHHQYRSLLYPHQGEFLFPLGLDLKGKIRKDEFIHKLNFEN